MVWTVILYGPGVTVGHLITTCVSVGPEKISALVKTPGELTLSNRALNPPSAKFLPGIVIWVPVEPDFGENWFGDATLKTGAATNCIICASDNICLRRSVIIPACICAVAVRASCARGKFVWPAAGAGG